MVTVEGTGGKVSVNPATLTFTADNWDTAQTVTVTGVEDADKNDETVTLRHTATGGGYAVTVVSARSAPVVVTVEDDEATEPGAPNLVAAAGHESAILRWTPPGDDGGAPVTGYQYRQGTGGAPQDAGAGRSHTVTGLVNHTEYSFQVRAVNRKGDSGWSDAKTVTPVPLTLTVEAVEATVTEGEPVRYRIMMSNRTPGAVVESVYSYEGEFVRNPNSRVVGGISSHGGTLSWVVKYDTVDDAVVEADGSFTVTIRRPDPLLLENGDRFDQYAHGQGYAVGTPSSATVKILDNDGGALPGAPGRPGVSVVSPTMLDATWGSAAANGAPVTRYILEYRIVGANGWTRWPEAIAPDARSVRLAGLSPGTEYEVRVLAKNVRGESPWSATVSASTAPDPGVTVKIERENNISQTEGDTLVFRVRASRAPASALRVDLRVTETLEMLSGRGPTSVTIPEGQRSATFEVSTRDDRVDEGYSEVTAEVLPSVRYLLGAARAMYRVEDDEPDNPDRGEVRNPRVAAIVDPRLPAEFQAHLEEPIMALRFTWTRPSDVALAHMRGWLVEWEQVESCSVAAPTGRWSGGGFYATADTVFLYRTLEAAHFRVTALLVGSPNGPPSDPVCGAVAERGSARGGVAEPVDKGPGTAQARAVETPELSVADASALEGGTLAFAVTLAPASEDTVRVDWATSDGTAQAGSDYTAGSGTLEFAPGETSKTIRVEVLDDSDDEGTETMGLKLSKVSGAELANAAATGTVSDPAEAPPDPEEAPEDTEEAPEDTEEATAEDSEEAEDTEDTEEAPEDTEDTEDTEEAPPAVVSIISITDAMVEEGPGAVLVFEVTLDRASTETVRVDWETRDANALAGEDYVAGSGTLVFAPGETAKTIRVEVVDDTDDEETEIMLVVLSNPTGATIAEAAAGGRIEN